MNKSWFHGFLIFISSLVFPCAIMEYGTPEFTYVQVWIFSFGVYIYEWDINNWTIGQFIPFSLKNFTYLISIIAVTIGLILTAEVISIPKKTELTKKEFALNILLFTFQVVAIIGLTLFRRSSMLFYIFPLPIPFLITILLLRHRGVTIIPFKNPEDTKTSHNIV